MLEEYYKKRNFGRTPEPKGDTKQTKQISGNKGRFVVQKHDATRLHYDFRLEDKKERVLKSWAVPKGISFGSIYHPVDYLLFEGVIPAGSYGAGTVIVWDTGTYTTEEEISDQFKKGKITFSLFGQKLRGKFKLIRIRSREEEENQWLLMKLSDGLESEEDLTINRPESVLIARTNDVLKLGVRNEDSKERRGKNSSLANASKMSSAKRIENTTKNHAYENQMTYANNIIKINDQQQEEYPAKVKPMLSTLVDKPFDSKDWVFEVKWDGYVQYYFFISRKGYWSYNKKQ